jgi:hypothetical protein
MRGDAVSVEELDSNEIDLFLGNTYELPGDTDGNCIGAVVLPALPRRQDAATRLSADGYGTGWQTR